MSIPKVLPKFFTARCIIVQSAILRLHVIRPSICDIGR